MSSSCSSSNSTTKTKEINVIVVGVSGSEAVKGPSGVGKSLLCNRFVRPAADEFHREHSSVLSQIDFCGSPVINKDHWLYWGSRVLTSPEASTSNVLVRVAEQTEFLDDETFETIAGCSKSENYCQRCSRTSLQSRDKLMYIQKEQLGLESEFPQHLLPDGKFNVDGFILACDVSKDTVLHSNQVINIAKSIAKTKKPIVIAFTKCDEMSEECKRHYMTLFLATKELKHVLCNLSPVETSSVKNVNVEYLFGCLAMLCLRSQKLVKKPPLAYHEASLFVEQRNLHVKCCFSTLLSQAVPLCVYPKKCLSWKQVLADIDRHPDLMNFVEVFGSRVAFEMYERYVSEAKELWAMNRLRSLVPRLFEIFQVFLDVVDLADMEWNMAREYMRCHPLFSVLFENNDYDLDMWSPSTFNVDEKSRLPAEILLLPEAGNVFEQFRHSTQNLRLKHKLAQEFEYLLHEIHHIFPGSSLDSSYPCFQHFSILKRLTQEIIAEVYDRFQQKLIENARRQMEECLLEAATVFQNHSHGSPEFLGIKQLDTVRHYIEKDRRYQWMKLIPAERDQIILTLLPFIFNPSPLNCPSLEMCIDMVGASILNDFSEQTSTFGGSSGFSECFEATRRNSGKKMARIQICVMCGDRLSIDSLAAALFHNDLIRSSNLNYSTDGASFIEVLDESTQNWSTLELSMNSYHSWTHKNDTNPQQFIDFTDGYLFVYNSKRASSFHYARCAIEKLGETNSVNFDCILLVAVVEGGVGGSDSMKIDLEYLTEGAELCKSIGARFSVLDFRKRKTKSNVLNVQLMEFLHDVCDGQVQPISASVNSEISSLENDRPSILAPSYPTSGIQLLTKPDTSTRSRRQKPINSRNRVTRTDPLIMSHFYSSPIEIQPAPLATPEAVDFSPAYSMVNDAVHTIIQVTGASPKTPPIFKNYENSSPETRSTTSTFSGSSPAPRAVSAEITRRPRTSSVSLSTDSINRLHRTSNLFQLHPDTAMTPEQKQKSLSIESLTKSVAEKDKNRGFVRKVATSFRLRKSLLDTTSTDENGGGEKKENKKKSSVTTSPEQISSFLEKMATRSLPQSPRTDRKAKLYSSLNSTTEKVSNVLSWLPSKSSKRLMKNKSATHDLSTSLTSFTASTSTQGVIASNENLESLCASSSSGIPVYLEKCIEFIENNGGFEQEGLYRVPGNQTHLAEVEKRFLKSGIFDVSSFDTPVHVAATALKSFFSCLPESLIPTNYHARWKQIMMNSEEAEKIEGIREALSQLPHSNQTVLRYLVKHLAKVSCSPKTVMNSNNLSKVWTPTLFRPVFTSYEELSSGIIAFQLALELIIIHSESLFP